MYSRLIFLFSILGAATAFTSSSLTPVKSTALQATGGRRDFVTTLVASTVLASPPLIASADEGSVDDLSMPTASEQKDEDAAMAERLRKKAELKKKMARPNSYLDSLKVEQSKKKDLQKSQEERRNALCEELGRGC